jgi:predicted phage terminase large subunit-like protein
MKAVAQADEARGYDDLTVWLEQEPGSGGKESAEFSIKDLAGFKVKADNVSGQGNKVRRAEPFAIQVEAGNIFVLIRDWTGDFIDQLHDFPLSDYKDMADSAAGAFNKIALGKKVLTGSW